MTQSILLTGANGFTGRALAHALKTKGFQVIELTGLKGASEGQIACDLTDRQGLAALINRLKVDRVIHLAAISFVASADTQEFYRTNVVGTCHLLEALVAADKRPEQVIIASSSNVYGIPGDSSPLSESSPLLPINHYACSKLAMEHMARTFSDELNITITRPFNYTGVGQADHFLVPKIVAHFASKAPFIELGNLDVSRDFTGIDDVVSAYLSLIEKNVHGQTLNICSGVSISLRDIVAELSLLSAHDIEVRSNVDFVRKNEIKALCGDSRKLQRMTGWAVSHPFKNVLRDMLNAAAER